jgi:hypothetical protein
VGAHRTLVNLIVLRDYNMGYHNSKSNKQIPVICLVICIMTAATVFADPVDEALLDSSQAQGTHIYQACIVTPPVTAPQKAICAGLYSTYISSLTTLNLPYPLIPTIDPDPYAWSPYDICRYETGHVVFGNQLTVPYCPTI